MDGWMEEGRDAVNDGTGHGNKSVEVGGGVGWGWGVGLGSFLDNSTDRSLASTVVSPLRSELGASQDPRRAYLWLQGTLRTGTF